MEVAMLVSILIPLFVAVIAFIASKVFLWATFRKVNCLNEGWEKLHKKLLQDGWVPPRTSKWFSDYVDHYHPGCNPNKCWVIIAEEERNGTSS